MFRISSPLLTSAALLFVSAAAQAQSRTLYATDGYGPSNRGILAIQGGSVVQSYQRQGGGAYAIAVGSDIRTFGAFPGATGEEYTFGGTLVGPTATNTTGVGYFYDGTTDGRYNYAAQYADGRIWRGGLDWSGMAPLFDTGNYDALGITYDSGNNSLWVSTYSGHGLFEYSMSGSLLSSFVAPIGGNGITALAFDEVDQTLWFSNYTNSATMYQYSRSGTQLATQDVSGTYAGYLIGAEFGPQSVVATPEPASLLLLGSGLLAVVGIARRKRSV